MSIVRWLRSRWRILKAYPASLLLIGFVVGLVLGWLVGSRTLLERLPAAPAKDTAYSRLSNEQLRTRSLQLVSRIRELVRSFERDDRQLRVEADQKIGDTKSVEEQNRIRKTWLDLSDKLHAKYMDQYREQFWSEAVLLRDALTARLPARFGSQNAQLFLHPTNILGVGQVANGLELLAKSLPEQEAR
jgi:hypothetical protein